MLLGGPQCTHPYVSVTKASVEAFGSMLSHTTSVHGNKGAVQEFALFLVEIQQLGMS